MPKPNEKTVALEEYWAFPQVQVKPSQLVALSKNVVANAGQPVEPNRAKLLDFLADPAETREQRWSDYWVQLMQLMGVGYTLRDDERLHETAFGKFVIENESRLDPAYLYWALRMQFPYAEGKHTDFKERGIAFQPAVVLLDHLVCLFEWNITLGKDPLADAHLTFDEIVHVLMKSDYGAPYWVEKNIKTIISNRAVAHDYKTNAGGDHKHIKENFGDRARLYLEKCPLLEFDAANERLKLRDWGHYSAAANFLCYRQPPIIIGTATQREDRIRYFESAFNNLSPEPELLLRATDEKWPEHLSQSPFPWVDAVATSLSSRGLNYDRGFVEAFLLSLKTKPFVILSGISGTGKSKLPRAIMEMVRNESCAPIAVAPDWTDNTDMLGYFDLYEKFVPGEFTRLVHEASQNLHVPHFVILDEMNLARVEYYFAQVLSAMESRAYDARVSGLAYRDYLFNNAMRSRLTKAASAYADLRIPANLFIIGTVNIDETTHPFSRKVLDRANVLEINDPDLTLGIAAAPSVATAHLSLPRCARLFAGRVSTLEELKHAWVSGPLETVIPFNESVTTWVSHLEEINEILRDLRLQVGYRVRDEVCTYMYHAALDSSIDKAQAKWWWRHFDRQLVQKILTRLEGEESEIDRAIRNLAHFCAPDVLTEDPSPSDVLELDPDDVEVRFPLAVRKLQSMGKDIWTFQRPSTSFWTA